VASVANIAVSVTARTGKFRKNMRGAQRTVKSFSRGVRRMAIGLAAAAGVGGLGLFIKRQFAAVDAIAKTSAKLGIATDKLAGLHHAAEITGIAVRTFDMGIQRMTRRVAEAAIGTGEAKDAIKQLGLDAVRIGRLSPDEIFLEIADAMSKVTSQGERVRLAFKLFDSEGVALLQTIQLGRKGLEDMQKEADKLGLTFGQFAARKVEAANDAMKRLQSVLIGVGRAITIHLAPFVESLAMQLVNASLAGEGLAKSMTASFKSMVIGIGTAIDWLHRLEGELINVANAIRVQLVSSLGGLVLGKIFKGTFAAIHEEIAEGAKRSAELLEKFYNAAAESSARNFFKEFEAGMKAAQSRGMRAIATVADPLKRSSFRETTGAEVSIAGLSTARKKPQAVTNNADAGRDKLLSEAVRLLRVGTTGLAIAG